MCVCAWVRVCCARGTHRGFDLANLAVVVQVRRDDGARGLGEHGGALAFLHLAGADLAVPACQSLPSRY